MARRRRPPRPGALTELPPLKILSQIVILQTIWYSVATGLILFTALVAGKRFSMDLVLSWRSLRGDTTVGWMLGLVWMMNSLFGYAVSSSSYVLDVVERTALRLLGGFCPVLYALMFGKQGDSDSILHLAVETRAGFCGDAAFHPPDRHVAVLALYTDKSAVVAAPDRERERDDESRGVELSVEGAPAD